MLGTGLASCTMRFGSTTGVLTEHMMMYYRISWCPVPGKQVKELFKELLRAHMEPNIVTYNTILRVWADEADAGKAVPLLYHLLKPQVHNETCKYYQSEVPANCMLQYCRISKWDGPHPHSRSLHLLSHGP